MIEIDNRVEAALSFDGVINIASTLNDREVELILTDNDEVHSINKRYRHIDKPTDVLSFPFEEMPNGPLGTIVISYDYVKRLSEELGHPEEDELALLFIHGMLHLLGYDHENDNGEMQEQENRLIQQFNLKSGLIIRSSL
jgi:probable rRNA maturation factor